MTDNTTYLFHQTPKELANDLITFVPLVEGDKVVEPFKGEGAFYDSLPAFVEKDWAEIRQGRDYTTLTEYDWVITNPPFALDIDGKRVNSFWYFLDYYSKRAKKGMAFLANDRCFSTLTPRRMILLKQQGWKITKVVVCSVKKWRGRYFFLILQKEGVGFMDYLIKNY
tara:strand:- start:285 stop:788 length:504 start_codon:yes stop_codon:yes gene_type:complete